MSNCIISYDELLANIEGHENHLLIGNGFNMGLGIDTSYKSIFNRMIANSNGLYRDAYDMVEVTGYDLEGFIGRLIEDIDKKNVFLRKYVSNKVKHDFMKATHEIVKDELKNVYAENNQGIYILLKQFDNYFTINYDSFLYILLLKFKSNLSDVSTTIALQNSIKFIEKELNETQNNIYEEIKMARSSGSLSMKFGEGKGFSKSSKSLSKKTFTANLNEYSKSSSKGWKMSDIERVVSRLLEEENNVPILDKVDDGSRQVELFDIKEFVFDAKNSTQNLFFLHGAFHIYKEGSLVKKITQKTDKALYDRLETILNNEEQDVVCVFQNDDKLSSIKGNEYLSTCYNKLKSLSGNIVIIGSSLSENDSHIFEAINNSSIENIYISTRSTSITKTRDAAMKCFSSKNLFFFDRDTISYSLPFAIIDEKNKVQ